MRIACLFFLLILTACEPRSGKVPKTEGTFGHWLQQQEKWINANRNNLKVHHILHYDGLKEDRTQDSVKQLLYLLNEMQSLGIDKFIANKANRKLTEVLEFNGQEAQRTQIFAEDEGKAGIKKLEIVHKKGAEVFSEPLMINIETSDNNLLYNNRRKINILTSKGYVYYVETSNLQKVILFNERNLRHLLVVSLAK